MKKQENMVFIGNKIEVETITKTENKFYLL